MNHYFCYEYSAPRGWIPVVYHGSKPTNERQRRSPLHLCPVDCIDKDGIPQINRLTRIYPEPAPIED